VFTIKDDEIVKSNYALIDEKGFIIDAGPLNYIKQEFNKTSGVSICKIKRVWSIDLTVDDDFAIFK